MQKKGSKKQKMPNIIKKLKLKKDIIAKYCLIFVSILILLAVILNSNLNPIKLLGNIYNVNELKSSIDNIKIGDQINYEINGHAQWTVLSIDKGNNTIDVVSNKSTENISLTGYEGAKNALAIFQGTADKYYDNKYVINARSVNRADLDNFDLNDDFWIANVSEAKVYYNTGNFVNLNSVPNNLGIRMIITLDVDNTSQLSIGDKYEYSSNGLEEWLIIAKGTDTISIINKDLYEVDLSIDDRFADINNYLNSILDTFKDHDNISSIRLTQYSDSDNLLDIGIKDGQMLTGNIENENSGSYDNCSYISYYFGYIYYNEYINNWENSTNSGTKYTYTYGFRPVLTLKYSDELLENKDISIDLKIGDNVNYSANSYNNWKVLSINKDNNTVDIISGGIVSNLQLSGIKDYENTEIIFDEVVKSYKNGDNVIAIRLVNFDDLENLIAMKDRVNVKYWMNNKVKYYNKYQYSYSNNELKLYSELATYSVAIASYSTKNYTIEKEYAILELVNEKEKDVLSSSNVGQHNYTAGIRPVITLKIDDVEKVEKPDDIITNDDSLASEQNKNNSDDNTLQVEPNETVIDMVNNSTNNQNSNTINDNNNTISDDKNSNIDDDNNKTSPNDSNNSILDKNEDLDNSVIIENNNLKENNNDILLKLIVVNLFVISMVFIAILVMFIIMYKNLVNGKK